MDIVELFLECVGTLTLNKMRTGLAALGIIIGIGSVIALISLGQGSQKSVENQIQSLGANLLTVMPSGGSSGGVRSAFGGGTTLTLDDAKALQTTTEVTTIKSVSPQNSKRAQVTAGRNNTNTSVIGVYANYEEIGKITLSSGIFLRDMDEQAMSKVAVLGPQVVSDLFDTGVDPIGQTIRINGQTLRVIGVTTTKGGSGFSNPDDSIYVPLSTAQKILFGSSYLSSIVIEAKSKDVMTQAQNEIGYFLLKRHKISEVANADFSIMSQTDILNTVSQVTGTFTALLGGIAAISLLVGGIGIMNIMLVTVTERTREIGLRKALGAQNKIIITQFLIEASILTLVGGTIGMLFGILTSYILSKIFSIPFTISVSSIFLAIGVSGGIGVLFGWYPAKRAAGLQPIEALRYE
jgi:putative ABC transport system permease protein